VEPSSAAARNVKQSQFPAGPAAMAFGLALRGCAEQNMPLPAAAGQTGSAWTVGPGGDTRARPPASAPWSLG